MAAPQEPPRADPRQVGDFLNSPSESRVSIDPTLRWGKSWRMERLPASRCKNRVNVRIIEYSPDGVSIDSRKWLCNYLVIIKRVPRIFRAPANGRINNNRKDRRRRT